MAKSQLSTGTDKHLTEKNVVFSDGDAMPTNSYQLKDRYAAFFSKHILDLRQFRLEHDRSVIVNAVFGRQTLLIPSGLNCRIQASTVFGKVLLAGRRNSSFGEEEYFSPDFDPGKPNLTIKVNVIFGKSRIRFLRS